MGGVYRIVTVLTFIVVLHVCHATADSAKANSDSLAASKMRAEIAKLEAEARAADAQSELTKVEAGRPYYKKLIAQGLVGALVTSVLLCAWIIQFVRPLMAAKADIAKAEVEKLYLATMITEEENKLEQVKLRLMSEKVRADQEKYTAMTRSLGDEAKELISSIEEVSGVLLSDIAPENKLRLHQLKERLSRLEGSLQRVADAVASAAPQRISRDADRHQDAAQREISDAGGSSVKTRNS